MDIQDTQGITTIVGNSIGSNYGVNLDFAKTYSERETGHNKIDTNLKPELSREYVLKTYFVRSHFFEYNKKGKTLGKDNTYQTSNTLKIFQPGSAILLEVFFLSLPEEELKLKSEIKWEDVFNSKYIIDLRPRLLTGIWDSFNLVMNAKGILSSDNPTKSFAFFKKDPKETIIGFENSSCVSIYDYHNIYEKEYFDIHLKPPKEKKGEKLFILTRSFYARCYFPFIREEFPKDILSEEQLIWVSYELGVRDKSLSRLDLWKKTKNALFNKCYSNDAFGVISYDVKILLLCTNRFEPDNKAFGKNTLPLDILKMIFKEGERVIEKYLSDVGEIERRVNE